LTPAGILTQAIAGAAGLEINPRRGSSPSHFGSAEAVNDDLRRLVAESKKAAGS
jgi:hypothetical protein